MREGSLESTRAALVCVCVWRAIQWERARGFRGGGEGGEENCFGGRTCLDRDTLRVRACPHPSPALSRRLRSIAGKMPLPTSRPTRWPPWAGTGNKKRERAGGRLCASTVGFEGARLAPRRGVRAPPAIRPARANRPQPPAALCERPHHHLIHTSGRCRIHARARAPPATTTKEDPHPSLALARPASTRAAPAPAAAARRRRPPAASASPSLFTRRPLRAFPLSPSPKLLCVAAVEGALFVKAETQERA